MGSQVPSRRLSVAATLAAAVAYALVLPLWEGFDEPFHYANVVHYAVKASFTSLSESRLPADVQASTALAPASHVAARNLPQSKTFSEWQRASTEQRTALRNQLEAIAPSQRAVWTGNPNYEAHHPPLAYVPLAVADWMVQTKPLIERVLILRLLVALIGTLTLWAGLLGIAECLELKTPAAVAAAFCCCTCQMTLAANSHLSNDYLSLSLFFLLVWQLLRIFRVPDGGNFRNAALTGLLLSAGLLSKAYFLALIIPSLLTVFLAHGLAGKRRLENLAVAAAVCGILAGPWYVRNWMLYGNWSGMIEATRGTGMRKAIANVADVPWASSIWTMLHTFVWTGNNSFLSFSQRTIELYLFVIACGLFAYAWYFYREKAMRREWPFLLCGAMFTAAILYSTALSYVFTRGESTGASPWYGTPLVLSAILLAFGGFARSGRAGRVGMAGLTCLSAYIALATFWLKLLPLYGGLYGEKTDLRTLAAWYGSALMRDVLSHTLLAPLSLTLTIIAVASVLIVLAAAFLVQRIVQSGGT